MEGVLGEIFQNYRVPPPPAFILVQLQDNLSSCLNCLNRFIVKVYSITVPNWELSFTVSVVPKLDRLDKLCRRRQWHPTPVLLPGKSHGRRSLVVCHLWGCTESDTTERLHFHFSLSCIGEGNGSPLQCSGLENPRDGEPGGLPSMGSHRVRHDWSNLAAAVLPIWIRRLM